MDKEPFISSLQSFCLQLCTPLERTKEDKSPDQKTKLVERIGFPVTGEGFSILIPTIIFVNGFKTLQL